MDKENVVYIYNGIVLRLKKEILTCTTWMDLEDITEISQSQKDKYSIIPLIRGS